MTLEEVQRDHRARQPQAELVPGTLSEAQAACLGWYPHTSKFSWPSPKSPEVCTGRATQKATRFDIETQAQVVCFVHEMQPWKAAGLETRSAGNLLRSVHRTGSMLVHTATVRTGYLAGVELVLMFFAKQELGMSSNQVHASWLLAACIRRAFWICETAAGTAAAPQAARRTPH